MWSTPGRALLVLVLVVAGACEAADGATEVGTPTASGSASASPHARGRTVPATFDSDGLALVGDLRLPEGPGPHPGIVLVGGSGPLSRDSMAPGQLAVGFPQPVAVFADLADGLRDAGYAVLTYDKRTCGPFNGCADNGYPQPADDLTVDVFASDALAAVAHLRSQPQVRPDEVAVAGHSQGASFVPGMLLDDPRLVAGVMLAAPFDPVDRLLAAQAATVERIVSGMVPPHAVATNEVTRLRELARSVTDLRTSGGGSDDAQIGGATAGFWRSWMRVTDGVAALAEQAAQPILVVAGAADTNVGPGQADRWAAVLTGEDDRVVRLDCVGHALNCLGTDDVGEVTPTGIDPHVDPRVVDEVAAFLDDALR